MKRVQVKSISKANLLPDTYFIGKYRCCPYQGCLHACRYCDGRSEKYYVEGDFDKDIVIRENLPSVLETSLKKARERGIVSLASGVSDAYQPLEEVEELTRQCGQVILRQGHPAVVTTKSSLIMRDIDLWSQVNEKAGFTLLMSLTHVDDQVRRITEPYTASIEERLKTLKAFKARGMSIGVLAMPILPLLDHQEQAFMDLLRDLNPDVVIPGGLTLRPGINKDTYFKMLKDHFPEHLRAYEYMYGLNKASGIPRGEDMTSLEKKFYQAGFPVRMVPKMYQGQMPVYDEIYILLSHMMTHYKLRGVDIGPLSQAFKVYSKWLEDRKRYYNRRRHLSFMDLESQVFYMLEGQGMLDLIGNPKLVTFLQEVVLNKRKFDYVRLKLED